MCKKTRNSKLKNLIMINKKILVIIPAYNEEKNIEKVIKSIRKNLADSDIVIIDDFSSDRTSCIAKKTMSLY